MTEGEKTQEALALLAIVALGDQEFDEGKGMSADKVFEDLRKKKAFSRAAYRRSATCCFSRPRKADISASIPKTAPIRRR